MSEISDEQVRAGLVDRPGELDLLVVEVALRVVGEQLGEDEQRVQRRAQLVAHVRQELALVLRGQRQLVRLLLERLAGQLDLAVLPLDVAVLLAEQRRLLLELLVGLAQLLLLGLQQLLGGLERLRLLLELGVGAPQLLLLGLQLLRALLQLARQLLRLLEQLLGALVGDDRVEHDAERLGQLLEERLVDVGEVVQRGELDDRHDLLLEEDGQDHDVLRRRLAEAARDLDVVGRRLGDEDRLGLERRLADERLADLEAVRQRLARLVAVGGDER